MPRVALFVVLAGCSLDDYVGVRPGDAGAEAGPSVAADAGGDAPAAPCAHTFCDDFDRGLLGERWDAPPPAGSGLSIDAATSVSPPNALAVKCGMSRPCELQKTFAGASRVRVNLDVLLVTPPDDAVTFSALRALGGEFYVEIDFRAGSGAMELYICSNSECPTSKEIGPLGTTRFRHVTLEADLRGGGVTVALDGATVLKDVGPIPSQTADGVVAVLGDPITSEGPASDFRIDNFSIDVL